MKTIFPMILIMLFMILAWTPNTVAQDYTQLSLPEGAKIRLGSFRDFLDFRRESRGRIGIREPSTIVNHCRTKYFFHGM